MYARVARFEGADPSRMDEQIAEMRSQIEGARSGTLPADAPAAVRTLTETVSRVVQLVDRRTGTALGMTFSETEDGMRRADEALNSMSPGDEAGSRTSVEFYEVALDEDFS